MWKRFGALLLAVAVLGGVSGCQKYDDISLMLGADVDAAEVVGKTDSHGGFHGDGERYLAFQFADDAFEDAIQKDRTWHKLPVEDDTVTALLYGKELKEVTYGPYIEAELPQVEKGYYFFYDRHTDAADPFDTSEVLERASFNFTAALYDSEKDILYFVEMDT